MEKDILFSQSVKAGQRLYYIDVKKNRREKIVPLDEPELVH